MIPLTHGTTIKIKGQYWEVFVKLVEDQFLHGGSKYGANDKREMTDLLCEMFGDEGVLWTMGKYLGRFKNQGREKDLLKLACYCFIVWLKAGFHLNSQHDTDTGVTCKMSGNVLGCSDGTEWSKKHNHPISLEEMEKEINEAKTNPY